MCEAMITRIKVQNFKSLADFEIKDLDKFVCLIGLNGTGKTTLLQFFDFVRAIMNNQIDAWFDKRRWHPDDIRSFCGNGRIVEFEIDITTNKSRVYMWKARFNTILRRCTSELVTVRDSKHKKSDMLLIFSGNKVVVNKERVNVPHAFKWGATTLSCLGDEVPIMKTLLTTRVLGILDPNAIAQPSQTKSTRKDIEVEPNGKGFIGFFSRLSVSERNELFDRFCEFYPSVADYRIRRQAFGWKNLLMNELNNYFDASHLGYGTLRILVFLSQYYSNSTCLLFDEIENGINQELVEKLVDMLQNFNKQIIVTTHSALVLNYLSDTDAKKSVIFMYKDSNGGTHAKKFFEIPEIVEKLDFLGPGEVMSDTDLTKLSEKLSKRF